MTDLTPLRGIELFEGLSEAQLGAIAAVVRRRQVRAGTTILREGDHGDSLFILASGSVATSKRLGLMPADAAAAGRQKVLVQVTAPQFFGEMGLLEDAERSATITAATDCVLYELARAEFARLVEADLDLGYRVVRNIAAALSARLRRSGQDVVKLTAALSLALGNR